MASATPSTHFFVRRVRLDEILALRHAELRPGLPLQTARFPGDDDPGTYHFGAFDESGNSLGCASFMPSEWQGRPAFQLRGMASRRDMQRRGIGAAMLRFAESTLCAETHVRMLWCNARIAAVPFYCKQGWTIVGDAFEIPTVGPHHRMMHALAADAVAAMHSTGRGDG